MVLLSLIAAAAWVDPDPRGYGTHRQFGLPPCASRWIWGGPCPTCGMTTAWAWLVRGEFGRAAAANPGGVVWFAAAMAGWLAVLFGPVPRRVWWAWIAAVWLGFGAGVWKMVT